MGDLLAEQLTDDQIQEFKEAFALFDKDGNGTITAKELGAVMRGLGQNPSEEEIRTMIDEVDTDCNGSIEFDEFLLLISNKIRMDSVEDELRDAFKVFDKDNDGYLTAPELRDVMMNLGDPMTVEDITEMVREADTNGDGKIEYSEFVQQIMSGL